MGKDFARHSGFFIYDAVFAYAKSGESDLLGWALERMNYHLEKRLPNGLVRGCIRSPQWEHEGQHDALTLCVRDAADLLGDRPEGKPFMDAAGELLEACRKVRPQQPLYTPEEPTGPIHPSIWVEGYFNKFPLRMRPASMMRQMHERSGCSWYLDSMVESARWSARHLPPPPSGVPVVARRYHTLLENALEGYLATGDQELMDHAGQIAEWAVRDLYRNGLFLGTSNMRFIWKRANGEVYMDPWTEPNTPGFYTSVTGTPLLVRTLLRLALVQEGEGERLQADPYRRMV